MKLLSNHARESALLVVSFLVLPLLAVSSGATSRIQQTPTATGQATSAATPGTRKFTVTVIGATGGFMTGLTRDSFAVFEGKSQREISYFDSADAPVSVGMLVDVSGSVERKTVEAARRAAMQFVEQSHPENEYFIGEFGGGGLRGLTDWTREPRAIAEGLSKLATANGAKPKLQPRGLTPLYDSCIAALEKLAGRTNQKRVLLLLGDGGGDNHSKHSFHDLRRRIRDSDVLFYALSLNGKNEDFTADFVGKAVIEELAAISGGWPYFVYNEKEADEATKRLAMELRHQYVVGFTPANAARGGQWNKVKIKVTPRDPSFKKIYVRSREGYFSTPSAP